MGDVIGCGPGLAVVVPVGPSGDPRETVESVLYYCPTISTIVLVDDSGGESISQAFGNDPSVEVIAAPPASSGGLGGLYRKVMSGFGAALDSSTFDVLIKMDIDALVTGFGLAEYCAHRFSLDPTLGVLGSYTTGPTGGRRDWSPARRILRREIGLRGLIRPALRGSLRSVRSAALARGYVDGEHALGGAYAIRRELIESLFERSDLNDPLWGKSRLGEDHLIGMMTLAMGFRIGDCSGLGDPFAIEWRGLSAEPAELLADGKMLVHSVDFSESLDESGVREAFRNERSRTGRGTST